MTLSGGTEETLQGYGTKPLSPPAPPFLLVHAPRVFLHVLWFSSLDKNQHSKFQVGLDARRPYSSSVSSSVLRG